MKLFFTTRQAASQVAEHLSTLGYIVLITFTDFLYEVTVNMP